MLKTLCICAVLGLLLMSPMSGFCGSYLSSGAVNASSGTPDKDLKYEDFKITPDGTLTGYIVNDSGRDRPSVRLDMWTTNMQETRIFWRKVLNIGDMAPHAKFQVKEVYKVDNEDPERTKFMFRIVSDANFRNK